MSIYYSKNYRPINEVDQSSLELRSVWWNPQPKRKLPNIKVLGGICLALLVLVIAARLVGILGLLGAGAYIYWMKKSNSQTIDATSLSLINQEIVESVSRAKNQIKSDLGISDEELLDAENNQVLINLLSGVPSSGTTLEGKALFSKINIYTAVITNKGVGYHLTTYDVLTQKFHPGSAELMLWNRIARVARDGMSTLIIEATSGTRIEIPLTGVRTTNEENENSDGITTLVNPFVSLAQRYLADN
jgi:hypothetical protein